MQQPPPPIKLQLCTVATFSNFVIYPLSSVHRTLQKCTHNRTGVSLKPKTDFLKIP